VSDIVFVTLKFACGTGTGVTVDVLFPGVGSLWLPVIVAVLPYKPVAFTVATIVIKAEPPLTKFPIVHVEPDQVPTDGVALTNVYPVGKASVITTPVALLGPALLAVIVKVTLLPTAGVLLLAVFITDKSANEPTVGETEEVLLVETGSVWLPVMVAVLVYGPVALTVAVILNVAVAPLAKLPIVQFGALHVPKEGVALTNV